MAGYDVVIVGSGINSLVCAVELTARGRRVLVLERADVAGGCIRTKEVTLPGFRHDLFSMSYPLFVTTPFYADLKPKLDAEGVRMVPAKLPTGVLLPDGRSLVMHPTRQATAAAFDACSTGDGQAFLDSMSAIEADAPLIFGLLGQEPRSRATLGLLGKALFHRRLDGIAAFGADALVPMRDWLEHDFKSDLVRALIAPWILHVGLGPESSISAMMAKVILFTLSAVGIPFVEGGSARLVEACVRIIEAGGGAVLTDQDVNEIVVDKKSGRARGVRTTDGQHHEARRGVVCNVTPTQLYGRLLPDGVAPAEASRRGQAYRYGRAGMQIHIALAERPKWHTAELDQVGLLHLTGGLDSVSRAINEADRGLLPAEGTIVVGQPADADPSRCPPGASLLWIQLQELPRVVKGDAAGLLDVPADGQWNDALAEAYADRIVARLRPHISNFDTALLRRHVLGPQALEAYNINLVGGDPYSGVCSIDQFHLLRPFGGTRNHATGIPGLHHIGASTHPGPGLGGVSGHMVAQTIG